MHPKHRAVAAAIALLCAATLLTGCLPSAAADPSPTPEVSESVTPEPTAAPSGSRPDARTDAECADLATPAVFASAFAAPLEPAPPTRTDEYIGAWISDVWYLRQAGGVACEWSSADSMVTSEGRFGPYQGAQVQLLPATDADWAPFSAAQAGGGTVVTECPYDGWCTFDQHLPNGWWLHAQLDGVSGADAAASTALATPIFATLTATVAALPHPADPWAAPVPTVALPAVSSVGGCEAIATSAQVAAALGTPGTVTSEYSEYPSITDTAMAQLGVRRCSWIRDGFWEVTSIVWLPGGAWAHAESMAAADAMSGSPAVTASVPGVPSGSAWSWQHVDSSGIDLVIGGNWIKVQQSAGTADDLVAAAVAVGTAVAANFPS